MEKSNNLIDSASLTSGLKLVKKNFEGIKIFKFKKFKLCIIIKKIELELRNYIKFSSIKSTTIP